MPQLPEAAALLERAVARAPRFAAAHAALGNALLRSGRAVEALYAYRLAGELDPAFAEAQLAQAELLHTAGDGAGAAREFARALAVRRVFPAPRTAPLRALALVAPLGWSAHLPLDVLVDPAAVALDRWYVGDGVMRPVPPYDLVINALGHGTTAAGAIAHAARIAAAAQVPVVNPPAALARTDRAALPATLRGVPGVVTPPALRVPRRALGQAAAQLGLPLVLRPVDAHGGRGLRLIDDRAGLAAAGDGDPAELLDAAAFVDYRSADGWYRKLRVVLIGGEPYPYHLAAAREWIVHYRSAATARDPALRGEERAFLNDPAAVLPGWREVGGALARALGLDYVGLDLAVHDGRWLIFEADAASLVYAGDAGPDGDDKRRAVAAIRAAFGALLAQRAARITRSASS